MDAKEIKQLIELMNANDLLELEVVEEGSKIRLKKMYDGGARMVAMPMAAPAAAAAPAPVSAPVKSGGEAKQASSHAGRHLIKSPMVGLPRPSANPESPPYVDSGDVVNPDTVVCILEAMKVFNEIRAEVSGKVLEVLVANGEAVEYGQPLMVVEPS